VTEKVESRPSRATGVCQFAPEDLCREAVADAVRPEHACALWRAVADRQLGLADAERDPGAGPRKVAEKRTHSVVAERGPRQVSGQGNAAIDQRQRKNDHRTPSRERRAFARAEREEDRHSPEEGREPRPPRFWEDCGDRG